MQSDFLCLLVILFTYACEDEVGSNLPSAGGNNTGDAAKMGFLTQSQRDTGVEYSGIKHSDDDLV